MARSMIDCNGHIGDYLPSNMYIRSTTNGGWSWGVRMCRKPSWQAVASISISYFWRLLNTYAQKPQEIISLGVWLCSSLHCALRMEPLLYLLSGLGMVFVYVEAVCIE